MRIKDKMSQPISENSQLAEFGRISNAIKNAKKFKRKFKKFRKYKRAKSMVNFSKMVGREDANTRDNSKRNSP